MRAKISADHYFKLCATFNDQQGIVVNAILAKLGIEREDLNPNSTLTTLTTTEIDILIEIHKKPQKFNQHGFTKKDLHFSFGHTPIEDEITNLSRIGILEFNTYDNKFRVIPYNAEHEAAFENQIKEAKVESPQKQKKIAYSSSFGKSNSSSSSSQIMTEIDSSKKRKAGSQETSKKGRDKTKAKNDITPTQITLTPFSAPPLSSYINTRSGLNFQFSRRQLWPETQDSASSAPASSLNNTSGSVIPKSEGPKI